MSEEPNRNNMIVDDRYKIIDVLGEGGMAIVYKAHDMITDKKVAVKMMKSETAEKKDSLHRFEREARAAASLNHPNIVKVINLGVHNGLPYMVNEFVNGQSLKEILDVRGFSFLEACDCMDQLCSAVYYAHTHGVIHRDIKPQNIFLTRDGTVKLGDFGIATFQNAASITKAEKVIGTVHYMAPEIFEGDPPSERSDIYAMGVTFFELITSKVPFDGPSPEAIGVKHCKEKFPNIRKYNSKCPQCIEKIIYKACSKNPSDRYASADQMKKDIDRILEDTSLLEKQSGFFFNLFHRTSSDKEAKKNKKKLKKAAKAARKENE